MSRKDDERFSVSRFTILAASQPQRLTAHRARLSMNLFAHLSTLIRMLLRRLKERISPFPNSLEGLFEAGVSHAQRLTGLDIGYETAPEWQGERCDGERTCAGEVRGGEVQDFG